MSSEILKMLQKTFDINLLTDHFFDLLSDIQNQVEVTLTRKGVAIAKILPLSSKSEVIPKAGLNRGSMVMSDDFDEPLSDEFGVYEGFIGYSCFYLVGQ